MAFDSRLLNIKDNTELTKVFDSINNKNSGINSKTPIPNQAFAPAFTTDFNFTKIIFTEEAYESIQLIRELDHIYTAKTFSNSKKTHPIKFACYGYKDFDEHIIITEIDCPLLEEIKYKNFSSNHDLVKFVEFSLAFGRANRDIPTLMREYLRNAHANHLSIGTDVVALIGQTISPSLDETTQNTFTMGELNDAVLPDRVSFNGNNGIISGILGITPKTVNYSAFQNRDTDTKNTTLTHDGSLECALITYSKRNNNTVVPNNIVNIKEASRFKDGKEFPLLISSSTQPLDYLYKAKTGMPIFARI